MHSSIIITRNQSHRSYSIKSHAEITKDKCDSTRTHGRHLAANGKPENKRKIHCTNVHLKIIKILITTMYKLTAVTLMPLHKVSTQHPPLHAPPFDPSITAGAPALEISGRRVQRLRKLVRLFYGKPGSEEFWTWKEDLMRAFDLSDINSPNNQVTAQPFLLKGDAMDYYHSLTKQVQEDWFDLLRVLGQCFDCISHEPLYLSRMLRLRGKEFPRHADYLHKLRTCVMESKVNISDLQMGYLFTSRFIEGLLNDAVRRQYIVEVCSKWCSGTPVGCNLTGLLVFIFSTLCCF